MLRIVDLSCTVLDSLLVVHDCVIGVLDGAAHAVPCVPDGFLSVPSVPSVPNVPACRVFLMSQCAECAYCPNVPVVCRVCLVCRVCRVGVVCLVRPSVPT